MSPHTGSGSGDAQTPQDMRLDVWLWAARWFKTRRLALEAVRKGKVRLDNEITKPGKQVRIGMHLSITKGPFTFEVQILALRAKRLAAKLTTDMYEESQESVERRESVRDQMKLTRLATPHFDGKGRPSKKDGRDLRKLKGDW